MISISHLDGMRQRTLDRIRIGTGPISAYDLNLPMVFEPGKNGVGCAIGQEVKWSVRLQVDQDGSIAVAASHGEVIESQDVHRGIGRRRDAAQVAQEGGC